MPGRHLVVLIFDLFTNHLTANPIQAMEQRTGRHALTLLVLSLACTPLNMLFGWRELLKRRRALGLYALMYATIHVLIFVNLDYGLAWSLIIQTVLQKSYIIFGCDRFSPADPLGHHFIRYLEGAAREELETAASGRLFCRTHRGLTLRPVQKRRYLPSSRATLDVRWSTAWSSSSY